MEVNELFNLTSSGDMKSVSWLSLCQLLGRFSFPLSLTLSIILCLFFSFSLPVRICLSFFQNNQKAFCYVYFEDWIICLSLTLSHTFSFCLVLVSVCFLSFSLCTNVSILFFSFFTLCKLLCLFWRSCYNIAYLSLSLSHTFSVCLMYICLFSFSLRVDVSLSFFYYHQ